MKNNEFAFYRKRIGQTQEKIADVLGIPLEVYKEIEDNQREVSKRVSDAFYRLLTRFPGSTDLSKPTIQAIDEYKAQYKFKTGKLPVGKHWIPFNVLGCKKILVDLSPYDEGLNKGKIKTEAEMKEWIDQHDLPVVITPEYFNHLTTLNNRELQEEADYWDRFYTARHYGKYQSRTTPKQLEEQIIKKKEQTKAYWIDRANKLLIKILLGLIGLWSLAQLIVFLDKRIV
jgi:transcriptional regulator with XRE-family HTH domain